MLLLVTVNIPVNGRLQLVTLQRGLGSAGITFFFHPVFYLPDGAFKLLREFFSFLLLVLS